MSLLAGLGRVAPPVVTERVAVDAAVDEIAPKGVVAPTVTVEGAVGADHSGLGAPPDPGGTRLRVGECVARGVGGWGCGSCGNVTRRSTLLCQ